MFDKVEFGASFLSRSPLFNGLSDGEINGLLERAKIHQFDDGETVVEEGSQGDTIFLLADGALLVTTEDAQGRSVELAKLDQSGAFFGEIALVDPGPRSATVRSSGSRFAGPVSERSQRFLRRFYWIGSGNTAEHCARAGQSLARLKRLVSSLSSPEDQLNGVRNCVACLLLAVAALNI